MEASFVAMTSGTFRGHPVDRYGLRLKMRFEKEDGRWLITGIDRYPLIGDQGSKVPLGKL